MGGVPGPGLSRRPPPLVPGRVPGGGGGWREREGGGGGLAEEVLVVLIGVKLTLTWRCRARRERQQGPISKRLEGEAREPCPASRGLGQDHLSDGTAQGRRGADAEEHVWHAPRSAGSSTDTGTARPTSSGRGPATEHADSPKA